MAERVEQFRKVRERKQFLSTLSAERLLAEINAQDIWLLSYSLGQRKWATYKDEEFHKTLRTELQEEFSKR